MALLDIFTNIVTVPAEGTVDVTPPVGEVWDFRAVNVVGDGTEPGWAVIMEGTLASDASFCNPVLELGEGDASLGLLPDGRIPIDSGYSVRIRNHAAISAGSQYSGWKTEVVGNIGAVRSGVRSVAADSILTVQPATGEQWLITAAGTRGDGTNMGRVYVVRAGVVGFRLVVPDYGIGEGNVWAQANIRLRCCIDDTMYLNLKNEAADERAVFWTAVQVKA